MRGSLGGEPSAGTDGVRAEDWSCSTEPDLVVSAAARADKAQHERCTDNYPGSDNDCVSRGDLHLRPGG